MNEQVRSSTEDRAAVMAVMPRLTEEQAGAILEAAAKVGGMLSEVLEALDIAMRRAHIAITITARELEHMNPDPNKYWNRTQSAERTWRDLPRGRWAR